MTPEQKQKIEQVLSPNLFGVIATNSQEGTPQSSLVGISESKDGGIVFRSLANSRKNQNIKTNPKVSMIIGFGEKSLVSLQLEGRALLVVEEI